MKKISTLCQFGIVAGFAFCLLATGSALGAKKPAEKEYRTTPTGTGALTPKMIRDCISMKKSLDDQADQVTVEKQQLDEMAAEIIQDEDQLREEEQSLDQSDRDAVNEYNGKVAVMRERRIEYQAKLEVYNDEVKPYLNLEKKFRKLCDNQEYYQDDYEQAKNEMGYGLE